MRCEQRGRDRGKSWLKNLPSLGAYTDSRHNVAKLSQISDPMNRKQFALHGFGRPDEFVC
jgi:hypothetical protein